MLCRGHVIRGHVIMHISSHSTDRHFCVVVDGVGRGSFLIIYLFLSWFCVVRKVDGARTPRDERRRAQHNEGLG